jgi:hypothetical protein
VEFICCFMFIQVRSKDAPVPKHHTMKEYADVEMKLHAYLNSKRDETS